MISGKTLTLTLGLAAAGAVLAVVLMDHQVPGPATGPVAAVAGPVSSAGAGGETSGMDAAAEGGKALGVTMAGGGAGGELLAGLSSLEDGKARQAGLDALVGRLAALGPEAALARVQALPDAELRDMAMLALLQEWSGVTTLELVQGGDVWRFGAAGALAVYLLEQGKISPEMAATLARASNGANRPAEMLARVASKMASTDPAAALALGDGLQGREQNRFFESLAAGWASADAASARRWASQIADPALRARMQAGILQAEAAVNPASAAAAFAQNPPDSPEARARLAGRIAESWAGQDTVAAMRWSAGLNDPAAQSAAQQGIQRVAPVGIGAQLATGEDGLPVLASLVPGSPASLSGQLQAGDKVVAVGDGQGGWVGAGGLPLGDLVGLIRGEPNTMVSLQVQSPGGAAPRVVTIGRQQIVHRPQ